MIVRYWGNKWHVLLFFLITLLGFTLRLLWIQQIPNKPVSDFSVYYQTAVSFFHHQGLSLNGTPEGYRGMGSELLLGLFFRLVGNSTVSTAKLLNLILSTISLVVFYMILHEMFSKKRYVFIGYLILALLPNYIAYNSTVGTEISFTLYFALTVWLSLIRPTFRFSFGIRYILIGLLCAAAALTRPFFLAYPAVLVVLHWIETKNWKRSILIGVTVGLVMALVIAPWTYRNDKKFGVPVLVSYNGGMNIFINNNSDNTHGGYMPLENVKPTQELIDNLHNMGARFPEYSAKLEPIYKQAAVKWIVTHPVQFAELGMIRESLTYFSGANDIDYWTITSDPKVINRKSLTYTWFIDVSDIIVNTLGGIGLLFVLLHIRNLLRGFFTNKRVADMHSLTVALNILFFSAIYFTFEGQARYNFPVLYLFVIAGCKIAEKLRERERALEL